MSFYEEQSSYNTNMPMKFLIYAGMVYGKYTEGTIKTLTGLVNKGLLSVADAASAAEMSVAEFENAAKAYI